MIRFFPGHDQTLVLPHDRDQIYHRLSGIVSHEARPKDPSILFSGWLEHDKFYFSLKSHRPNNFIPYINGMIEPTSTGSIVFITYRLFPFSKMVLIVSWIAILLSALSVGYQYDNLFYGFIGLGINGIIYWIAWINFKIHLIPAKETLTKVIT